MKNRNWKNKLFNRTAPKPAPRHPHLTEENALASGESAFRIRVPMYNNPYNETHLKNAWIRGFKRAERLFLESIKRSSKFLETLPLEEVET